jgi:hypothetical protein
VTDTDRGAEARAYAVRAALLRLPAQLALQPPVMPYYHNTDAELNPGDELLPSAERGHRSRWAEDEYGTVPTYDPHSVYMYRETGNPEHFQEYGKNRYEVEPVGDVRRDPEWLDLMEDDEEIDPEDFGVSPEDAPGFHSYVAPRAKVVRKL